jgi:sulfite reductase beta subunit-like hemoprotein
MTIAEFEDFLDATKHMTAVQRAEAYGIDISLIDENLRLTPTQKIRQNDIALNQAEALQAALNQTRAKSAIHRLPTR